MAEILNLPEAVLAYVLRLLPTASDICNALSSCRTFSAAAAADPAVWQPLAVANAWLLRRREDEAWLPLVRRAHCCVERIVAMGGDELDGERTSATFDIRAQRWCEAPLPKTPSSAPCAAVDSVARTIFLIGGYDEYKEEAIATIERLTVDDSPLEVEEFQYAYDIAKAKIEDIPVRSVGGVWKQDVEPLTSPRCFASAVCDDAGRLWVCGGGDGMSRGAQCLRTIEYLSEPMAGRLQAMDADGNVAAWRHAGEMLEPRCGHALAVDARASELFLIGGYSGGTSYQRSVETFDMRGVRPQRLLPPMSMPRSGCGAGVGQDGALYVVGGSEDGIVMLACSERFDSREGVWRALPPMSMPRGYLSATFALDGCLYVVGGCGNTGVPLTTCEAFDARKGRWRALPPLPTRRAGLANRLLSRRVPLTTTSCFSSVLPLRFIS